MQISDLGPKVGKIFLLYHYLNIFINIKYLIMTLMSVVSVCLCVCDHVFFSVPVVGLSVSTWFSLLVHTCKYVLLYM
jgi:hypothetical protein